MKPLTKLQTLIFQLGGVLVLAGIVLWIPRLSFAPYVFCIGALCFASMQMLARYEGKDLIVRRLRRQQVFGAICLVLTGILMIGGTLHLRFMSRNEWVVTLTIAAIFELYTAFRIPVALKNAAR